MSAADVKALDELSKKGERVTVGVLPDLDPIAAYFADLWTTLRSSTPHDQPIAIISIATLVGAEAMRTALPLLQTMDRTYFDRQRERAATERKRAEAQAKARRGGRR